MSIKKHIGSLSIAQTVLGILLLAMGLGQLISFDGFAKILQTYQVFPSAIVELTAALIVFLELASGLGLVFCKFSPSSQRLAANLALTVAVVWTLLGLQAFLRGLTIPNCGCFGEFLAQPLRWWILIEDGLFVYWAVYVVKNLNSIQKSSFRRKPESSE